MPGTRISNKRPNNSVAHNTTALALMPATEGITLAINTPSKAKPSRHATHCARCAALPPSRAPKAWCVMVKVLNAT